MATSNYNLSDMVKGTIPSAQGLRFGIVVSEWNDNITEDLLHGAVETLKKYGANEDDIMVKSVPGSFELVFGCSLMVKSGKVDAVIAIGCVVRGDTPHFEYISGGTTQGLTELNIRYDVPVIFGLLTTNSMQQAEERSGGLLGNKGDEYAITAIKMADFARSFKQKA